MNKKIRWADEKKQDIVISETKTVEKHTNLRCKEHDLEMAKKYVIEAQQQVNKLEAEIAEIKTALNIKEVE